MSSRALYRLSGGTLIISSILILVYSVLSAILYPGHNSTPQQTMSPTWSTLTILIAVSTLLFVISVPGMYLRQAGRAGVLGLVGFVLLLFGILLQGAAFPILQVIVLPFLAQKAPQLTGSNSLPTGAFLLLIISGLMQLVGAILLGIATIRAKVFPRLAGIFLLISGIAFLLTLGPFLDDLLEVVSFAALAAAFAWCGYLLVAQPHEEVAIATRPGVEA